MIKIPNDQELVSPMGKTFKQQEPEWLDNSGYSCYSRCPAKYFFSSILGLKEAGLRAPLEYGTAVHEAMPFLQRGQLDLGISAFKAYWDPLVESGKVYADECRNTTNGERLLRHWYQEKIESNLIPYEMIEPPQGSLEASEGYSDQEFAFCVEMGLGKPCAKCDGSGYWIDVVGLIDNPRDTINLDDNICPSCKGLCRDSTLPFAGRVDGLSRNKSNGRIWLVEYKTAAMFGNTFSTSFDLNSQPLGYAVAMSILHPEYDIQGCFLEALRTSKTNPANLTIPIFYEEDILNNFIVSFNDISSQIKESWRTGEWDQKYSACAPYAQFGTHGYQCPYASMCKTDDWNGYLDKYIVNRWKPFVELSGEGGIDG